VSWHVEARGVAPAAGLTLAVGCAGWSAEDKLELAAMALGGKLKKLQKLLTQEPARFDSRTDGGQTPLMTASEEGHVAFVRWLVKKGAAVNGQSGGGGRTPLFYACREGVLRWRGCLFRRGQTRPSSVTTARPA
jgi:hypothetical protein